MAATAATGDRGPGTNLADLLPLPSDIRVVSEPGQTEAAKKLADGPTLSHELAVDYHEDKGHAQQDHDNEVLDLGWNKTKEGVQSPLVGGIDNEELWLLVRRFNKQVYHVRETVDPPAGGLDLNIADHEEFSPDKLRSTLERLYMTVIIGALAAVKHVARLRSWREARRTACFCAAYFLAWTFDLLSPLLSLVLLLLIASPRARALLFPAPRALSLVSATTGAPQAPKAAAGPAAASADSATGAAELHKGEAVEREASHFVAAVAAIALGSAAGKRPQGDREAGDASAEGGDAVVVGEDGADGGAAAEGSVEQGGWKARTGAASKGGKADAVVPDPTDLATGVVQAKDKAAGAGVETGASADATKLPMEQAIWAKTAPVMHALGGVADTWERVANALSPTTPFPKNTQRLRLAGLVLPVLVASCFITPYMVVKGMTFGIGFAFFGDPIISRGVVWLNRTFPNWQKLLEIRNTILKGVPTNAQLTLTLLRVGEAHGSPLPPPPRSSSGDADTSLPLPPVDAPDAAVVSEEEAKVTTRAAAALASAPPPPHQLPAGGADADADGTAKKKGKGGAVPRFLLGLFRGTASAGVHGAMGADSLRAAVGSTRAKNRLGVVVPPAKAAGGGGDEKHTVISGGGPVEFPGRYGGRKGRILLTTRATVPCVAFSTDKRDRGDNMGGGSGEGHVHPAWSVPIADVAALRKVGGYGWKAKLVVGWATGREVADGIEVVARTGGTDATDEAGKTEDSWVVTAIRERDELFNRLVAIGGQKWESW